MSVTTEPSRSEPLSASHALCREVSKRRARNFYYGMKLVPEPKRSAMYAVYGWMRQADDLTDEAGSAAEKAERIERFREQTRRAIADDPDAVGGMPEGRLWPAVRETVRQYSLPSKHLDEMLDGQRLDLEKHRYRTFEELADYCYKVASVVGLSCIEIWGYEGGDETRRLSASRGIAFQLTNILRDVREDAERGRVYLPEEDFDGVPIEPAALLGAPPASVLRGIRRVAERAADFFERSEPLVSRVDRDGRACLWAMSTTYRALLRKIERNPRVVFDRRVRLGSARKSWIALRASLKRSGS